MRKVYYLRIYGRESILGRTPYTPVLKADKAFRTYATISGVVEDGHWLGSIYK